MLGVVFFLLVDMFLSVLRKEKEDAEEQIEDPVERRRRYFEVGHGCNISQEDVINSQIVFIPLLWLINLKR
jgi:hypothetical protein